MARIAGVNIPTNKRVEIALTYIHGIGDAFAKEICQKVSIPSERRVNELTESEVIQIRESFTSFTSFASFASCFIFFVLLILLL